MFLEHRIRGKIIGCTWKIRDRPAAFDLEAAGPEMLSR